MAPEEIVVKTVVQPPTRDEARAILEAYTTAVGKVAHSWNYLFERLGELFCAVTEMTPAVALAIWYAPDIDRVKVEILRAAVMACPDDRWLPKLPSAKSDLIWLTEQVSHLADMRNNAVHAPCSLITGLDGTSTIASYFSGHSRAKKLRGKDILVEFDFCERWAEELSRFTRAAQSALYAPVSPSWPQRPVKPNRKRKIDLPSPPHQPRTE